MARTAADRSFADVAADVLASGNLVRFRASGRSMLPTIRDGDMITVAPVSPSKVLRGDVVLYRTGRRVFAHRVIGIQKDDRRIRAFLLRGDDAASCDAPVEPERILGKLVVVSRSGRATGLDSQLVKYWRVLRGRLRTDAARTIVRPSSR